MSLFVSYLMTLSVSQTIKTENCIILVNNELEEIWKGSDCHPIQGIILGNLSGGAEENK
jgi:hypothetical protein